MEVFTNCSTACSSNLLFYLLLNGSGVGRCYDDAVMLNNFKGPKLVTVLDEKHPDFGKSQSAGFLTPPQAKNVYFKKKTKTFLVPDSREGWAKATELWENLCYSNPENIEVLILDFSNVRPEGSPIKGMQNRPSSGPIPLMESLTKAYNATLLYPQPWKKAMYVDHYLAECVRVGGARRAARIATKYWRDPDIIEFIKIKEEGGLWSANNSVGVDAEFWQNIETDPHAMQVFKELVRSSYQTGEPGIINLDKLNKKPKGLDTLSMAKIGNAKFQPSETSVKMMEAVFDTAIATENYHIVNPCGEISLALWGGFCVIGDVVPYHCESLDQAEDAFRATTRALIRVNTMDSIYGEEVTRTNRIGVALTGIHEFAWKFFKYGFRDLIDESKSKDFWDVINRFREAVIDEAISYSKELGVETPHTMLTIKPAGCQTLDTMVSSTKGILHLSELGVVDQNLKHQPIDLGVYNENGKVTKADEFFVNGVRKVDVLTLDSGLTLKCTPNHKYRVLRDGEYQWLMSCQLQSGDKLPYEIGYYEGGSIQDLQSVNFTKHFNKKDLKQPTTLSEDLAWFIGVYFGDGSNHTKGIRISGNSKEQKGFKQLLKIAKQQFGIEGKILDDRRENHNGCSLYFNQVDLVSWLTVNGICKQKSTELEIPKIIRQSPKNVIEAFIEGYYVADGCSKSRRCTSVTTSYKFAQQLTVLLRAIGRDAKMRLMPPTKSSYGKNMRYWVSERAGRTANPRYVSKSKRHDWAILDSHNLPNMNFDVLIDKAESMELTVDIQVPETKTFYANSYVSHNTTSKLFGLCEGWHLPSLPFYLRWTQFRNDDPLVEKYKSAGYPVKQLQKYEGTTIVGFPTQTEIGRLNLGEKLITAAEATPEEQYIWLKLGERHWLGEAYGNQISYTLKYHPEKVSLEDFSEMLLKHQSEIKCCSVMPHMNSDEMVKLYEYLPEQQISLDEYNNLVENMKKMKEDLDQTHIDCENGACPIDFNK
jgi:ribonucleotide reductase alpha subunit